jgi:hypothetical protein
MDAPHIATHKDMVAAILEVTGWRIPAVSGARVGKLAKDLLAAGVFPHDVALRFGASDPGNGWWWYTADWRGKLGQRPDEKGLRECAGKWELAVPVTLARVGQSEPAGYAALRALREADGR